MMKTATRAVMGLSVAAMLAACAQNPDKIQATHVSPEIYKNSSCKAIIEERNDVVTRVAELTGAQAKKSRNDKIAVGVGIFLWPAALFVAAGSDAEAQIASLQGHYDALTKAGISKGCITE